MEYDQERQIANFISGLILGVVIGAGVALLTAPQPGRRTRRRIRKAAGQVRESAGDRLDELAEDVKGRVDEAIQGARERLAR